jgi:hypothetical protein
MHLPHGWGKRQRGSPSAGIVRSAVIGGGRHLVAYPAPLAPKVSAHQSPPLHLPALCDDYPTTGRIDLSREQEFEVDGPPRSSWIEGRFEGKREPPWATRQGHNSGRCRASLSGWPMSVRSSEAPRSRGGQPRRNAKERCMRHVAVQGWTTSLCLAVSVNHLLCSPLPECFLGNHPIY